MKSERIESNCAVNPGGTYYSHLRPELLKLSLASNGKVLEVGCAAGETLLYFKSRGASLVVGVELVPEVAARARVRPEIDEVLTGNIEDIELPYAADTFDLLIASHVLEHVRDPWTTLSGLIKVLRPGGQLIGSLPNVRCLSVTAPLICLGRWNYTDEGILDRTHYRFFTRSSVRQLLVEAGLEDIEIRAEVYPHGSLSVLHKLSMGLLEDFCAYTFNFSATRPR